MRATKTKAEICYTKTIGGKLTLAGFAWEGSERFMEDFDLKSLGEVLAYNTERKDKLIGWAVYETFNGKVGNYIKLKRNW